MAIGNDAQNEFAYMKANVFVRCLFLISEMAFKVFAYCEHDLNVD